MLRKREVLRSTAESDLRVSSGAPPAPEMTYEVRFVPRWPLSFFFFAQAFFFAVPPESPLPQPPDVHQTTDPSSAMADSDVQEIYNAYDEIAYAKDKASEVSPVSVSSPSST
jgi:hypothetical protein